MIKHRSQNEIHRMRQQLDADLRAGRLYIHEAAKGMRHILGKTQRDFADLLGIAERTYIDIERGVGNPTLETLSKIGALFGLAVKFGPYDTLRDNGDGVRGKPRHTRGFPRR
jgi:DNA-binding XRE family transcriptional regulator